MVAASLREYGIVTVRDILHHAFPPSASAVAGLAGLGREVTWATRLRPAPPAFGHISGGEMVLLPPDVLPMIDEHLTLADAIRQLSQFGIAAVGTASAIDSAAKATADAMSIPLIHVDADTDFGLLERSTSRAIAERRRDIQATGQDAGRILMERAITGDSLDDLLGELAERSGRPVMLESREGTVVTFQPDDRATLDEGEAIAIAQRTQAPVLAWLRSVGQSSAAEPPVHGWTTENHWTRLVAPVTGRTGLLGSLTMLVPEFDERPEDTILTARAAAAAAVSLSREQAANSVRREVELNVLDELLDGALRSEVSLLQQAQRLGYNLDQQFCAVIARIEPAQGGPTLSREGRWSAIEDGLDRVARSFDRPLMWRVRNANAEMVWPITDAKDRHETAGRIHATMSVATQHNGSQDRISLGVGRPAHGIQGIRQSHQEARQALTLGRRLHGAGAVTDFDDLGIFRLILAAEHLPELEDFQREALSSLIEYDRAHGSNLLPTLEAFFAANCSPKEAATLLNVHRNTVLYRLDRIAEITGMKLDDPSTRLRLHLALHIRMALGA